MGWPWPTDTRKEESLPRCTIERQTLDVLDKQETPVGLDKLFRVFISAVTSEFGPTRQTLAELIKRYYDIDPDVQSGNVLRMQSGPEIMQKIDEADLIICFIGRAYGRELPPGDRPPYATDKSSWTQWEYPYAREAVRTDRHKRLLVYYYRPLGDAAAAGLANDAKMQQAFLKEVHRRERATFEGLFFVPVEGHHEIVTNATRMFNERSSFLRIFQETMWGQIKDAYRQAVARHWSTEFKTSYRDGEKFPPSVMNADYPPFIESQRFQILSPDKEGQSESSRSDRIRSRT
jgi:hypothetical protein